MAGKLKLLIGFGAGYVLGARAGRERYEQIVARLDDLRGNPRVQSAATHVRDIAAEKAGEAQDLLKEKMHHAAPGPKHADDRITDGDQAEVPPHGPAGEQEVTGLVTAPVTPPDSPR